MNSITALRNAYGFSQSEMAAVVGTTQGSISRWESGQEAPTGMGNRQVLMLLEDHLDVLKHSLREQLLRRGPLYAYYLLLHETYGHTTGTLEVLSPK